MTIIHKAEVVEDTQVPLIARVTSISGSGATSPISSEDKLITQADVSSISVKVYDSSGTLITSATPSAASTVFDTIQTSLSWQGLTVGGNFRYILPAAASPVGNTTNRVEILITQTDGTILPALWDVHVTPLYQS
jgi:hypothetical protein